MSLQVSPVSYLRLLFKSYTSKMERVIKKEYQIEYIYIYIYIYIYMYNSEDSIFDSISF